MQALQEENEKLKKENEMLKERMDYLRAVQATHIDDINDTHAKYRDMVLTLKTQKNKLSKKNTELRKEIKEVKEERDEFKRQYEKQRMTSNDRLDELAKIVCPHSIYQDHKRIKEGCLKLSLENEKLKEEKRKEPCIVDYYSQ